MHSVIHAFSNHAEVLHSVTPIEPVGQSAFSIIRPYNSMEYFFNSSRMDCLYRHDTTTLSGCACHPSTGGE